MPSVISLKTGSNGFVSSGVLFVKPPKMVNEVGPAKTPFVLVVMFKVKV